MTEAFVDTDVLVRFVTGDDPAKQAAAARLLQNAAAGDVELRIAASTVAELLYVITSPTLYRMDRGAARDVVLAMVTAPGLRLGDRSTVLRALSLFSQPHRSFGDAMLVATMERDEVLDVYSYDAGFDRNPTIRRIEP